ncbi:ABC transporter permease [Paludicola sp. MB14-C6]|uniref:ABC transporter permease n=1 Tax=Paludihabitans sp. MB14-C6 TaxID=3070656 RepID=UPI0027DCDD42|nr:ABC transporter permease [Paludicola sp. MB14-C6]WMJ22312.1 ABC transporter permease [Paludicola sp. MB14-C6]
MSKEKDNVIEEVLDDVQITEASFELVGKDAKNSEAIVRPSLSYWKDAMRRLVKNKVAVVCAIFLAFIILMAIIVPMVSPYTISDIHIEHTDKGMFYTAEDGHMHIFGTDSLGRDIFVRIWSGARVSMFIAFTAVFINFIIGIIYGGISGYVGGRVDNIMMRIIEIINGIPYLMIVILLMMVMEAGIGTIIIAYAAVGWTGMARLVRGQVMTLKEQEFVVAAKSLGAKPSRILAKHLLPNTLSVVIVNITLAIPSAIFTEAFLSFIGLGVPIPNASWGTLANDGVAVFQQHPHMLFIPAFFISLTMLSFNLLGDALRDVFDPRLRK